MIALLVCAPILALMGSWLQWNNASFNVLAELTQTVLPDYIASSLVLCLGVAFGVTVIGLSTAAAVTLFKFPGQSWIEWALLLPMAMPAYVVAYAYTDFLQYSGPLQNLIRHSFALEGRVFPEIRSLGGAIFVFTLALYPYVYLLVRSALTERASKLIV
jgi:iron(III) transport system permease protein